MLVKPWFTNQTLFVYKRLMLRLLASVLAINLMAAPALAQDKGTLEKKELPPIANPNDPKVPAKELFGRKVAPVPMQARVIGFYAKGCIAGAKALPINGETWQVMRLSRNRNWGHPQLVALLERLSKKSTKVAGWQGLLVGDMSQPRGGPMLTGHASMEVAIEGMEVGAFDYLMKPMDIDELLYKLQDAYKKKTLHEDRIRHAVDEVSGVKTG